MHTFCSQGGLDQTLNNLGPILGRCALKLLFLLSTPGAAMVINQLGWFITHEDSILSFHSETFLDNPQFLRG